MRRWILIELSTALVIGAVVAFLATRPPPFDAFPKSPPSPSIATDGTTTFTIDPGTEVNFPAATIEVGDVIICAGKGRRAVPPLGHEINGRIHVYTDPSGNVVASCAPHPLAEM